VVDPELKLLPLHFLHDPGPTFDWSTLNNKMASQLEPGLEDRLNLLKRYMDVRQLPYTCDPQVIGSHNSLLSSSRQLSTSSGSDDGSGSNPATLKKEKKEGKSSVAKQFGSLGKSVGKKLKNLGTNLGGPAKPSKEDKVVSSGLGHTAKVHSFLCFYLFFSLIRT
jgi:OTU domain-containing protein 7